MGSTIITSPYFPATSTKPGIVTIGEQTLGGEKNFAGGARVQTRLEVSGTLNFSGSSGDNAITMNLGQRVKFGAGSTQYLYGVSTSVVRCGVGFQADELISSTFRNGTATTVNHQSFVGNAESSVGFNFETSNTLTARHSKIVTFKNGTREVANINLSGTLSTAKVELTGTAASTPIMSFGLSGSTQPSWKIHVGGPGNYDGYLKLGVADLIENSNGWAFAIYNIGGVASGYVTTYNGAISSADYKSPISGIGDGSIYTWTSGGTFTGRVNVGFGYPNGAHGIRMELDGTGSFGEWDVFSNSKSTRFMRMRGYDGHVMYSPSGSAARDDARFGVQGNFCVISGTLQAHNGVSLTGTLDVVGTTRLTGSLSVSGSITSTVGGFTFPDGTTQETAATGGGTRTVTMVFGAGELILDEYLSPGYQVSTEANAISLTTPFNAIIEIVGISARVASATEDQYFNFYINGSVSDQFVLPSTALAEVVDTFLQINAGDRVSVRYIAGDSDAAVGVTLTILLEEIP